ncbi:MAG: hypothetical protein LAQ69_08935 [Acidobacteriia bacterium]|nr:hypothetical protein [Terriglobia bacterium]
MNKLPTLLLFLIASAGFANTIRVTGLPANTQYGTYNGFAFATIDGAPAQLICDDFNHDTFVPSGNMTYNLSTLTGPNPLQYARFVDPNQWDSSIVRYEEAAVLLIGLRQTGPGYLLDLTADYQYALWMLFTPGVTPPNATAQTLLNDAAASVQHSRSSNQPLYSALRIYTPTAAFASNQEFLNFAYPQLEDTLATPEPSPMILIAIGIAAMTLSGGSRRLRQLRDAKVRSDSTRHGSGQ